MEKQYDAKKSEKKWQQFWEKEKIYKFDIENKSKKPIFSIDTPPPFASAGHLHVGHALHYTQFEIIARYKRMAGFNVYFPPCFDDNGLPTEKYVEEELGISKKDKTKAEFRKICLREAQRVEEIYSKNVFKKLGHSYDWSLLYTTISPEAQKVAQKSFLDLIRKGDCYRTEGPVIWCIKHETALAQAEVEDIKRTTHLNYIDFDIKGSKEKITIATTRPELLSSCVGVFVHPEDKRHKKLIGKKVSVPIFNYEVKVLSDEKVDMDFGTGIVMVCTFGDKTDMEWWKKHNLPLKISIDPHGELNKNAGKFRGLGMEKAKKKILEELKKQSRLKKQEKIEQTLGSCWRCNTPIEYLVTKQWFIKTLKYKKELIQQGRKIKWHPEFMKARYEDWVKNLGWDWCISRQRFFGIPVPVWYCKKCGIVILPEEKQLPLDSEQTNPRKKCICGSKQFESDHDVFDTWMISSMSPEIALRWLKKPSQFKKLFPMSLRPQAQDIIRTWAFYTILKAYLHFKKIPWRDIALGTFVLDSKGRGMSKSKRNVVWADELLKKYNVDTFRYWVGNARWGSDLPFKEKDLVSGRRFLKKLWNASRFVLINSNSSGMKKPSKLEIMDKWNLIKLDSLIKKITKKFNQYETGDAKRLTERFFWDFTDNYLEIVKNRVYQGNKQEKQSAQYVLLKTLLTILKLLAPIIPHITEEIYQKRFAKQENKKSIHIADWPKQEKIKDKNVEEVGDLFIKILKKVRQEKAKNKKSVKAEIILTLEPAKLKKLEKVKKDLMAVLNAEEIKTGKFKVKFV